MAKIRKYRLSDTSQDVDLRQYEDEIVSTINETVPGKHPKVYADYFTTDQLTHSEAVKIGRALSKSGNIATTNRSKYSLLISLLEHLYFLEGHRYVTYFSLFLPDNLAFPVIALPHSLQKTFPDSR